MSDCTQYSSQTVAMLIDTGNKLRGVEGYAIVSADGMLADRFRHMPRELHVDADQCFFTGALDQAALVVHGRHSHEQQGPASDSRRRVILTRGVDAIAVHPSIPNALLWTSPFRYALPQACQAAKM